MQFHDSLRLESFEQNSEHKANVENPKDGPLGNGSAVSLMKGENESTQGVASQMEEQGVTREQPWLAVIAAPTQQINSSESINCIASVAVLTDIALVGGRTSSSLTLGRIPHPTLLDERSLLACIVHAILAGSSGRIRISTTLPNRLGKMLTPLHWHNYKKQYGKLDDFVARHPELFVIEGDFIHLLEGAQKLISATTAIAKVAAATAISTPYSSLLPTVAITPVAHNHCLKRVPSIDPKSEKTSLSTEVAIVVNHFDVSDKHL